MKKLSRWTFSRGAKLDERDISDITMLLSSGLEPLLPPEEVETNAPFNKIINNHLEWAKERFQYDLSERVCNDIRVYEIDDIIEHMEDGSIKFYGRQYAPLNLIVLRNCKETQLLHLLGHEQTHALSHWGVHVEKRSPLISCGMKFYGYQNAKNKFNYLNEVVTESINLEALNEYNPDMLKQIQVPYIRGIIVLDNLIDTASSRLGTSKSELRDTLYRGYFEGKMRNLHFLKEAYGAKTLGRLADMHMCIDPDSLQNEFDTPSTAVANKCNAYIQGEEIDVLDGIKLQLPLEAPSD